MARSRSLRRVQFELDEATVECIDEIVDSNKGYASSRKDVVRHALGLYFQAFRVANDDGKIFLEEADGNRQEILLLMNNNISKERTSSIKKKPDCPKLEPALV